MVPCLVRLWVTVPREVTLPRQWCWLKTAEMKFLLPVPVIMPLTHLRIPGQDVKQLLTTLPVLPWGTLSCRSRLKVETLQTTLKPVAPVWWCLLEAILLRAPPNSPVVAVVRTLLLRVKVVTSDLLFERRVTSCSLIRSQLVESSRRLLLEGTNVSWTWWFTLLCMGTPRRPGPADERCFAVAIVRPKEARTCFAWWPISRGSVLIQAERSPPIFWHLRTRLMTWRPRVKDRRQLLLA